jgi:hypothetical protein
MCNLYVQSSENYANPNGLTGHWTRISGTQASESWVCVAAVEDALGHHPTVLRRSSQRIHIHDVNAWTASCEQRRASTAVSAVASNSKTTTVVIINMIYMFATMVYYYYHYSSGQLPSSCFPETEPSCVDCGSVGTAWRRRQNPFSEILCLKQQTKWRMASSGMLRHVALVWTDVSEELSPSVIRVRRICELGTTLAVTSRIRYFFAACFGC